MVLCHGWLDQCYAWYRVAETLHQEGYDVLAFDWRGHGRSSRIGAGGYYYFCDYLPDLRGILSATAGESERPPHLVGHSMGGVVCAMLTGAGFATIASLHLVEGMGPPGQNMRPPAQDDHATRSSGREPLAPPKNGARHTFALRRWLSELSRPSAYQHRAMSSIEDAARRLRAAEPRITPSEARELATHAIVPAEPDGFEWRYDPLHRTHSPYPSSLEALTELYGLVAIRTAVVSGSEGHPVDEVRKTALAPDREHCIAGGGHNLHWTHPQELAAAIHGNIQAFVGSHT